MQWDVAKNAPDASAVRAALLCGTHLTTAQKAKAVDLAAKCLQRLDAKSVPKKAWLALQINECLNRAIVLATDLKVWSRRPFCFWQPFCFGFELEMMETRATVWKMSRRWKLWQRWPSNETSADRWPTTLLKSTT